MNIFCDNVNQTLYKAFPTHHRYRLLLHQSKIKCFINNNKRIFQPLRGQANKKTRSRSAAQDAHEGGCNPSSGRTDGLIKS